MLLIGARSLDELPQFGHLTKLPKEFIEMNLALARVPGEDVARLLKGENTYVNICGVKDIENGVEEAFAALCQNGLDWSTPRPQMLQQGRYHVETY